MVTVRFSETRSLASTIGAGPGGWACADFAVDGSPRVSSRSRAAEPDEPASETEFGAEVLAEAVSRIMRGETTTRIRFPFTLFTSGFWITTKPASATDTRAVPA